MPTSDERVPCVDFAVRRDDWRQCRVTTTPLPDLAPGQVLFRIDRFAFTANNVTYALTGDMLGYWRFFPAEAPWGRLPVMGFGDVVASTHPDVAAGERLFGFFPMSSHLVITVGPDATGSQIVDAAAHRADTALPYRQYLRPTRDDLWDAAREDALILLRGLFITSFLVDDYLADHDEFGARTIVISSASSKTAIALAFLRRARGHGPVVGLTSARNRDFVTRLGCYDRVLTYDAAGELAADAPAVFVDHSGDAGVVEAVHRHFGERLMYSGVVGATHWEHRRRARDLPGPAPAFFFAPSQLEKRTAEWGAGGFQARLADSWHRFVAFSDGWLTVERGHGPDDVERVYRRVLEGQAEPDRGYVLSLA